MTLVGGGFEKKSAEYVKRTLVDAYHVICRDLGQYQFLVLR